MGKLRGDQIDGIFKDNAFKVEDASTNNQADFETSALTGNKTFTLPDKSGTVALLSDTGLPAVLGVDSSTGANDISIATGQKLTSAAELNIEPPAASTPHPLTLKSGSTTLTGAGANASLIGGDGGSNNGFGGKAFLLGGNGIAAVGFGGEAVVKGGNGGATADAGGVTIDAGTSPLNTFQPVNISNTNATTTNISTAAKTQALNLNTGAATKDTTIGSLTGNSFVRLKGGTSGIYFQAKSSLEIPFNAFGDADLAGFTATSVIGALNELKSSPAGGTSFFDATIGSSGADYTTAKLAYDDGKRSLLIVDDVTEAANLSVTEDLYISFGIPTDGAAHVWDLGDFQWTLSASTSLHIEGKGRFLSEIQTASTDTVNATFGGATTSHLTTRGIAFDINGTTTNAYLLQDINVVMRDCRFDFATGNFTGLKLESNWLLDNCHFAGGNILTHSCILINTQIGFKGQMSNCLFDGSYDSQELVIVDSTSVGSLNSYSNISIDTSVFMDFEFTGVVSNITVDGGAGTTIVLGPDSSLTNCFFEGGAGQVTPVDNSSIVNVKNFGIPTGSANTNVSYTNCEFTSSVPVTDTESSYVGCDFQAGVTFGNISKVFFTNCTFGTSMTTTSTPTDIIFNSCYFTVAPTLSSGATKWSFTNCYLDGGINLESGAVDHSFVNCRIDGGNLKSDDNKYIACLFPVSPSSSSFTCDGNRFQECTFEAAVSLGVNNTNFSYTDCVFEVSFAGTATGNRVINCLPITEQQNHTVLETAFKVDDGSGNTAEFRAPSTGSVVLTAQDTSGTIAYTTDISVATYTVTANEANHVVPLGVAAAGPFFLVVNGIMYSDLEGFFVVSTTTLTNDTWTWQDIAPTGQLTTTDRVLTWHY